MSEIMMIDDARKIYPCAIIREGAKIYDGAIIYPGAKIYPGAIIYPGAEIYEGAIIYPGAIICEDAEIYEGAEIREGAIIHDCAEICAGAIICKGATIRAGAIIYPGAEIGKNRKNVHDAKCFLGFGEYKRCTAYICDEGVIISIGCANDWRGATISEMRNIISRKYSPEHEYFALMDFIEKLYSHTGDRE